ncbi:MAG: hypothetical protein H6708_17920 [Kofleriaceae bacterium]|nr:hypothetical protein [Myxococcales bacterium]MCB9562285.1 hypothetical protein [Kofleriaceae bacterium]
MTRTKLTIALLGLLGAAALGACAGEDVAPPEDLPEGNASGGEGNTFDHPDTQVDVWALLDRLQKEGPPKYTARVHSCPKIRYETIGRLLASRGVDLGAGGTVSAGALYRTGDQALGVANYGARIRENVEMTTAGASRLFDIFVASADEIIANIGNRPECQIGGVGVQLFGASNQCDADGISCLIGYPATASHIELCNLTVQRASDPEVGKRMAVAVLAAAAHTCE